MRIDVAAITDKGLIRNKNQDCYFCNGILSPSGCEKKSDVIQTDSMRPALFGVFDGMGGHLYGERASEICGLVTRDYFASYSGGNPETLLGTICKESNNRICNEMRQVVKGRMGSTAAMLMIENNNYTVANLGDSPVFIVRQNRISQISFEHTERQNYERINGKKYSPDKKFKLTQHLGIFSEEMEIEPYIVSGNVFPGDIFIICSDGLTDMVKPPEILTVAVNERSTESTAFSLMKKALENGGKDNVSIIIIRIEAPAPVKAHVPQAQYENKKTFQANIETKAVPKIPPLGKALIAILIAVVAIMAAVIVFLTVKLGDVESKLEEATAIETTQSESTDITQAGEATVDLSHGFDVD